MKSVIILALTFFSLGAANAPAPWLDETQQGYINESAEEDEALFQETCLSYEEQQAERDAIAQGITVNTVPNFVRTSEVFSKSLNINVIYNNGTALSLWLHLAHRFNRDLVFEFIEDVCL